ncbi:mechanosensitive ion channel protein 10-like [Argentina anserina]|uniref:mechanosensitive ion channel protein 10-like n=1 Tax=Argentina anserina TaxID=57926 RepID=UPI0021764434|nr:mechanosensitive ion channel protein 10-like [Potentilla anserina]
MSENQVVLEVSKEEIHEANSSASPENPTAAPERKETLNRSVFSKPKSRFGSVSPTSFSRTPVLRSPGRAKEANEESYIGRIIMWVVNKRVFIEWIVFLCILGVLVACFTVDKLDHLTVWSVEFWKWCVLVMVIFRGMLLAKWFMRFTVYVSKSNFWLRKKMLYFVHGMKQCVQVFMWLGMLLLTWLLLFDHGSENSHKKILHYVTRSLVSILIAAFLWSLKTLSLKILALRFYLHTFFDRTRESMFHQYVIQTLSGPPIMEIAGVVELSPFRSPKSGQEDNVIDIGKLLNMKLEEVSARTMEVLVEAVSSSSGLSTFLYWLDDEEVEQKEIASEMEATAAAYRLFHNVAKPGCRYIEDEDLMRFMIQEEVEVVLMLIDVAGTGRIDRRSLTDWVVKVYNARKGLIHSLTDTKKAVKQLDKLVTSILIVISILVWLLLVEIATTKVLVFLSSQLVLAAFIFGNTCKNIFEAVVFVFVIHPFHVGDRCLVDGVLLTVEEMNILTTVFSKQNNDKVYYPNSVLSALPISNCKDNSDTGDVVEFSITFTSVEKIDILKERIKGYIELRPQDLHPKHNIAVNDIENGNMLKMALYFNYILKSQEFGEKQFEEKTKRRSQLVIQLMTILEELNITCSLQPPHN